MNYDKVDLQIPDVILRNIGHNAAITISLIFHLGASYGFSGLDYLPSNEHEFININLSFYKQEINELFDVKYVESAMHAYVANAYSNLPIELHNDIIFSAAKGGQLTIKYMDIYGNEYYHDYKLSLFLIGLKDDNFKAYMTYPTYSRKIKYVK